MTHILRVTEAIEAVLGLAYIGAMLLIALVAMVVEIILRLLLLPFQLDDEQDQPPPPRPVWKP